MGKKDKERRVYTREFKAEAAALAEKHEKPVRLIAADLGINENMLRRWMREARDSGSTGLPPFPDADGLGTRNYPACGRKTRLCGRRREAPLHLKSEKKRPNFSSRHLRTRGTPLMAYRFMKEHRKEYTIRKMDMTFWGKRQRLLPVGKIRRIGKAEGSRCGTGEVDSPDCSGAPQAVRQPEGAGGASP